MLKRGSSFKERLEQSRLEILKNKKELERIDLLIEDKHSVKPTQSTVKIK